MTEQRFRIAELEEVTARALQAAGVNSVDSGRVRSTPDVRSIRYYTTIGLLDRPAEMRGRTAYYNRRHVLQLMCIKRLQSQGKPLVEIQTQLAGATDKQLKKLAGLPASFWKQGTTASQPTKKESARKPRSESFWQTPPAPASTFKQTALNNATTSIRIGVADGVTLEFTGIEVSRFTAEKGKQLAKLVDDLSLQLAQLGLVAGDDSKSPSPLHSEQET